MNGKMKLIERLIKDGSVDLAEAMMLLETEKEQIFVYPYPRNPFVSPLAPYNPPINPFINPITTPYDPYKITCGTSYVLDIDRNKAILNSTIN